MQCKKCKDEDLLVELQQQHADLDSCGSEPAKVTKKRAIAMTLQTIEARRNPSVYPTASHDVLESAFFVAQPFDRDQYLLFAHEPCHS